MVIGTDTEVLAEQGRTKGDKIVPAINRLARLAITVILILLLLPLIMMFVMMISGGAMGGGLMGGMMSGGMSGPMMVLGGLWMVLVAAALVLLIAIVARAGSRP